MQNFTDFLKTGHLGNVCLELTESDLYNILGEPENQWRQENVIPGSTLLTLYYGDVEIDLIDQIVHKIGIYFRRHLDQDNTYGLPRRLLHNWFEQVREMDYGAFVQYAHVNSIDIEVLTFQFQDEWTGQTIKVKSSGVELNFDNTRGGKIDTIMLAID